MLGFVGFVRLFLAIGIEFARTLEDRRRVGVLYSEILLLSDFIGRFFYTVNEKGSDDPGSKFFFRNLSKFKSYEQRLIFRSILIVKNLSSTTRSRDI